MTVERFPIILVTFKFFENISKIFIRNKLGELITDSSILSGTSATWLAGAGQDEFIKFSDSEKILYSGLKKLQYLHLYHNVEIYMPVSINAVSLWFL